MNGTERALKKTAFILVTAGFMIALIARCGYWSFNWETGNINKPNWLRIRFLIFYLMPLALMMVHFLVNRKKTVRGFYIFACILMAGQALLKALGFMTAEEKQLFLCVLEGVAFGGFLACAAETQQMSEGRLLPLLILTVMVLVHGCVIVMEGRTVFRENQQTVIGIYYVLSEAGLIFFDIAAILDLVSGEVPEQDVTEEGEERV